MKPSEFKDMMKQLKEHRRELQESINAIKEYKRQQKTLYRSYYRKQEDLDRFIAHFREQFEDEFFMECVDMLPEIDTSEIFYKKTKLNYTNN